MASVRILGLIGLCGLAVSLPAMADNRTMDGSGNNLMFPAWGQAHTSMARGASGAHYADGMGEMFTGPNPRAVSNAISAQTRPVGNARLLSSMTWQWGQFIDHDFALVDFNTSEPAFVSVPAGDPVFDPGNTGTQTLQFFRSVYTGGVDGAPREQATVITHWIDGSQVYGSDSARGDGLRTHTGGRLATAAGDLLPFNTAGLPNAPGPGANFRVAGDIRSNEQTGLTAMHTVFVREHNRQAALVQAAHPDWDDEQVYQRARKIVGAEIQAVTYNEWLPAVLGPAGLGGYSGYNGAMEPSLNTVFSSAAFRIGHTMLNEQLLRLNEDGTEYAGGHLTLFESFFNTSTLTNSADLNAVLRGLAAQQANEIDTQAVDSIRNMLFEDPGPGSRDLIATNLQRARDHGLPDYNTIRQDYGLPALTSFAQVTSDPELAAALAAVYENNINGIDPWIGLMAEDHLPGASVGETIAAIFRDQFGRLRDADRMFYLADSELTSEDIAMIEGMTLSEIIRLNTGIESMQGNVFFVPAPGTLGLLAGAGLLAFRRRR